MRSHRSDPPELVEQREFEERLREERAEHRKQIAEWDAAFGGIVPIESLAPDPKPAYADTSYDIFFSSSNCSFGHEPIYPGKIWPLSRLGY